MLLKSLAASWMRLVLCVVLVLGGLGGVDGASFSVSEVEKTEVKSDAGIDKVKAWEFSYGCPKSIRSSPAVLERLSIALQRGVKQVSVVSNYANHPQIIDRTVEHVFRGHGANGGRHHISALLSDNSRMLVNRLKETSDGFYEAVVKRATAQLPPNLFGLTSGMSIKSLQN